MLKRVDVANGGRLRSRLYAMMSKSEKVVFDRWARRIGMFYIAAATVLIAVATLVMPPAETSAITSLHLASSAAALKHPHQLEKRVEQVR